MTDGPNSDNLVELAADVVATYVSNNTVTVTELPSLIARVHKALVATATGSVETPVEARTPAVSIQKSIHPDSIVCREDGKTFKSLKRHLCTKYARSPDDYSAKWGLPGDDPMGAPNDAAARSEQSKSMGLGQQRRKTVAAPEPVKKSRKAESAA